MTPHVDSGSGLGLAIVRRICQRNAIALNYARNTAGCAMSSLKTSSRRRKLGYG